MQGNMGLDFSHCEAGWAYSAFNEFRQKLEQERRLKPWREFNGSDPIFVLLQHSDCEGFIEPEDCTPLAVRLAELVRGWEPDDGDRYRALMLVKGLRIAGTRGERLVFKSRSNQ